MKKVNCSDWHRRWSGYLGKLEKTGENTYRWTGHWQGRHGQKGPKHVTNFALKNGGIEREIDSVLPHYNDVLEAIRILNS